MAFKKSDDEFPSEKDDILGEENLEELDLDSLLDEDKEADDIDLLSRKKKPAAPRSGSPGGSSEPGSSAPSSDEGVIDHGELDLLADDEPLELSGGDLVEVSDGVSGEAAGAESKSDRSSNNGSFLEESADSGVGGSEAVDEISPIDLLAEDDSVSSGQSAAPRGTADEDETRPFPNQQPPFPKAPEAPEAGSESSEKIPEKKERKGTQKLGKGLKKLGKTTGKRESGKSKDAEKEESGKEAAPPAARPKVSRPKTAGALTFICSECYEEFLLPPSFSQEMVSCPECLHVGKRPEENFLRTVSLHKNGERKSFVAALAAGLVVVILLLAFLWLKLPTSKPGEAPSDPLVYGLLGASALGSALFVWLIVRSEGNRWEVYF